MGINLTEEAKEALKYLVKEQTETPGFHLSYRLSAFLHYELKNPDIRKGQQSNLLSNDLNLFL